MSLCPEFADDLQRQQLDDLQRQLVQSLQEVSEAAKRADRISKQAKSARASAAKQMLQAAERVKQATNHDLQTRQTNIGLEERLLFVQGRLAEAEGFAEQQRSMCKGLLAAKVAAEGKVQALELERDTYVAERNLFGKARADFHNQIHSLQAKVNELEAENAALRAAQVSSNQERQLLAKQIQVLEQTSVGAGQGMKPRGQFVHDARSGQDEPPAAPWEDDVRGKYNSFSPQRFEPRSVVDPRNVLPGSSVHTPPTLWPNEANDAQYRREPRQAFTPPTAPPIAAQHRHGAFPVDRFDLDTPSRLTASNHECPTMLPKPAEKLLVASSKPHGSPGSAQHESHEAAKPRRLADGIDLLVNKNADNFEFAYAVTNNKLTQLEFVAELDPQSENMCWRSEHSHGNKCKITLKPREQKVILGSLVRRNPHATAKLKGLNFSWTPRPLDKQAVKAADAAAQRGFKALEDQMHRHGILASKLITAETIQQRCRKAGIKQFLDVEFPPNDKSLFADPNSTKNPPVIWRRPKEFLKGTIRLFTDCIHPSDIAQGALGDCWYLASLAAMAEFPKLVEACFAKTEYNDLGVYEILCFKNGMQTSVIVDDLFPCDPESGKPCYSHVEGNELWVLLLEKAWAKLHGTYERIEGGIPHRALMDLTGDTGRTLNISKEPSLWERLLEFDRLGYLMCASTPGEDHLTKSTGKKPSAGIVPGHAYTLKGAKQYGEVTLVNLRNPWGQFEWDGDWSDKSPLWTQEMKNAFHPTLSANDGSFWMSFDDFLKHYDYLSVLYQCSRVGDKWLQTKMPLELTGENVCKQCLSFKIEVNTVGFFTLLQRDERILGTPDYVNLAFAVYGPMGAPGGPKEVLRSPSWSTREIVEEVRPEQPLKPGDYVVAVYNPSLAKDRTVALLLHFDQGKTRGSAEVPTKLCSLRPEMRQQLALATAIGSSESKVSKLGPFETSGAWTPCGGYALAVRNLQQGAMSVDWDFSKCSGLRLASDYDEAASRRMKVSTRVEAPTRGCQQHYQLVAELLSTSSKRNFGFGISYKPV